MSGTRFADDPVFGDVAQALAPRAVWAPSLQRRPDEFVNVAFRGSALQEADSALWSDLHGRELEGSVRAYPGRPGDTQLICLRSTLEERSMDRAAPRALLAARDHEWAPPPEIRLMGVINVTPDSFSDGGAHPDPARAIDHGLRLAAEGARILDVGGESTRPGSSPVSEDEERRRVVPVVEGLAGSTATPISVDTSKASVARAALDAGATIVNDVSAGRFDPGMLPLVAERGAGLVLMHMQGTPRNMQDAPEYGDVVSDVLAFLRERGRVALEAGVDRAGLWVDPGIGFGKTLAHNLELLTRLSELRSLGLPVCVGASRKSFIAGLETAAGTTPSPAAERTGGTAAAVTFAVLGGASVLRVHDVGVMAQAVLVARALAWKGSDRA